MLVHRWLCSAASLDPCRFATRQHDILDTTDLKSCSRTGRRYALYSTIDIFLHADVSENFDVPVEEATLLPKVGGEDTLMRGDDEACAASQSLLAD